MSTLFDEKSNCYVVNCLVDLHDNFNCRNIQALTSIMFKNYKTASSQYFQGNPLVDIYTMLCSQIFTIILNNWKV